MRDMPSSGFGLFVVVLIGVFCLVQPLAAQVTHHTLPAVDTFAQPTVQITTNGQAGEAPTATNAVPIIVVAQLVRTHAIEPPLINMPETLASFLLTKSVGSLGFVQTCSLTNSSTMLECALTPTGAIWGLAGAVTVRVQLTGTDGNAATALANLNVGHGPAAIQAQINAGTGANPATTNANPVVLVAQLIRTSSPLPPGEATPILTLSGFSGVTFLTGPGNTGVTCSFIASTTALSCTFAPTSGNWSTGGPLIARVTLYAATDGSTGTTLVQFRIAP